MATIGMDQLFYAKITEDAQGNETYGPPVKLARAMQGDLSLELAEAQLFADDGAIYVVKSFRTGTLSLGVDDIGVNVAADLTGSEVDDNGVLVSASENMGESVAIGFRAMKPDGKYRYFWLYKVKFGFPPVSVQTKGDSITFQTPTIEGVVSRRNRADERGQHPWKAEVTEGDLGVDAATITGWFEEVYEPEFTGDTKAAPTGADAAAPETPVKTGKPKRKKNTGTGEEALPGGDGITEGAAEPEPAPEPEGDGTELPGGEA